MVMLALAVLLGLGAWWIGHYVVMMLVVMWYAVLDKLDDRG